MGYFWGGCGGRGLVFATGHGWALQDGTLDSTPCSRSKYHTQGGAAGRECVCVCGCGCGCGCVCASFKREYEPHTPSNKSQIKHSFQGYAILMVYHCKTIEH